MSNSSLQFYSVGSPFRFMDSSLIHQLETKMCIELTPLRKYGAQ